MDNERWKHVQDLFEAASEMNPRERAEYLAGAWVTNGLPWT